MARPILTEDIVHSYGYDNVSRVTSFNTTGTGAATRSYAYDDAGQLTAKTGSAAESYTYDDNGNRTAATTGPSSGVYLTDPANRILDDGSFTYTYDSEGNVTKRTLKNNPSDTREYTWDQRNRLVRYQEKDNGAAYFQIDYFYDANGRRVARKLDIDGPGPQAATSDYSVYDGSDLALTFNHAGQLTHRYQYGPLTDQVLADEVFTTAGQSDEIFWLLGDQQGTIRDIAEDTANLRKHIDYDSFGAMTHMTWYGGGSSPLPEERFGYTGQEWDPYAYAVSTRRTGFWHYR